MITLTLEVEGVPNILIWHIVCLLAVTSYHVNCDNDYVNLLHDIRTSTPFLCHVFTSPSARQGMYDSKGCMSASEP